MIRGARAATLSLSLSLGGAACGPAMAPVATSHADFETPRHDAPRADDARLSVHWLGHASMLVQMDDKFILTDPFLVERLPVLQRRLVSAGLSAEQLPRLDAVLVSHVHTDHLSYGSLKRIQRKVACLLLPQDGLSYMPDFAFEARELRRWQSFESGGLRITAVPVAHAGGRYGLDAAWMTKGFTGYVVEYHGLSVYFAGDTAYAKRDFEQARRSFPHLDLALLPIAPMEPSPRMREMHMGPSEALDALTDLGASKMVPMHFDTLRSDDAPGQARETLVVLAAQRKLHDRVNVLHVGERSVIVGLAPRSP